MQLLAVLLQSKERGDPQGWLAFQVGPGCRAACRQSLKAALEPYFAAARRYAAAHPTHPIPLLPFVRRLCADGG